MIFGSDVALGKSLSTVGSCFFNVIPEKERKRFLKAFQQLPENFPEDVVFVRDVLIGKSLLGGVTSLISCD